MTTQSISTPAAHGEFRVSVEVLVAHDQDRADLWALLGALLLRPAEPLLQTLARAPALPPDADPALAAPWQRLIGSARSLGAAAVQREHAALFDAVGRPLVDPYESLYRSGSLMDRSLSRLRADLRALGQARRPGAAHTEDHLGALCETMRLLITGADGLPRQPLAVQRHFYAAHLLPWAGACLDDIRLASGAAFYAALADFFRAFMKHEASRLDLDDTHSPELHDAALCATA